MNKDLIITLLLLLSLSLRHLEVLFSLLKGVFVFLWLKKLKWIFFSHFPFCFIIHSFACETKFVQLNILFVMIINLTRWSSNLSSSYSKFSSRDHLRSRIICGPFWGSFSIWGSIAARVHLRYCTDLVVRNLFITEIIIELGYSYAVIHLADFRWRT